MDESDLSVAGGDAALQEEQQALVDARTINYKRERREEEEALAQARQNRLIEPARASVVVRQQPHAVPKPAPKPSLPAFVQRKRAHEQMAAEPSFEAAADSLGTPPRCAQRAGEAASSAGGMRTAGPAGVPAAAPPTPSPPSACPLAEGDAGMRDTASSAKPLRIETAGRAELGEAEAASLWEYRDDHGDAQGPFTAGKLASWLVQGHVQPTRGVRAYTGQGPATGVPSMRGAFSPMWETPPFAGLLGHRMPPPPSVGPMAFAAPDAAPAPAFASASAASAFAPASAAPPASAAFAVPPVSAPPAVPLASAAPAAPPASADFAASVAAPALAAPPASAGPPASAASVAAPAAPSAAQCGDATVQQERTELTQPAPEYRGSTGCAGARAQAVSGGAPAEDGTHPLDGLQALHRPGHGETSLGCESSLCGGGSEEQPLSSGTAGPQGTLAPEPRQLEGQQPVRQGVAPPLCQPAADPNIDASPANPQPQLQQPAPHQPSPPSPSLPNALLGSGGTPPAPAASSSLREGDGPSANGPAGARHTGGGPTSGGPAGGAPTGGIPINEGPTGGGYTGGGPTGGIPINGGATGGGPTEDVGAYAASPFFEQAVRDPSIGAGRWFYPRAAAAPGYAVCARAQCGCMHCPALAEHLGQLMRDGREMLDGVAQIRMELHASRARAAALRLVVLTQPQRE